MTAPREFKPGDRVRADLYEIDGLFVRYISDHYALVRVIGFMDGDEIPVLCMRLKHVPSPSEEPTNEA